MLKREINSLMRTLRAVGPSAGMLRDAQAALADEDVPWLDPLNSLIERAVQLMKVPGGEEPKTYALQLVVEPGEKMKKLLREGVEEQDGVKVTQAWLLARQPKFCAANAYLSLTKGKIAVADIAAASIYLITAMEESRDNNLSVSAERRAESTHAANRAVKAQAQQLWGSREWRRGEAVHTLAKRFHRGEGTVKAWIAEWKKER